MTKALEVLRADLARSMGRFFTGTADTNAVTTSIVDAEGLARYTETDALKGALAYIRTDAGGAGAAPEDEARWIAAFTAGTDVITVDRVFSQAVVAGDIYEVYRAPLTKEQWDEAINLAIQEAWPEVYEPAEQEVVSTGATEYALANTVEDVIQVNIVGTALSDYADLPMQTLPRHLWTTTGVVGASLKLQLVPYVDAVSKTLQVIHKTRFAELAKAGTTTLDWLYIMRAGKAHAYEMLAGEAGTQASAGQYMQLMNHWSQKAEQRKMALGKMLLGMPTIREVKD